MRPHLRDYDPAQLAWRWEHPDPRVDALQSQVAALVASDADGGTPAHLTHQRLRRHAEHVARDAGIDWRAGEPVPATPGRPRLSEPWFC
jgi:hypothetical protein